MFYAGIGSRQTPKNILEIMFKIGKSFAHKKAVLRSGHASGADMAFENGCIAEEGPMEIFIPWKGFNGAPDTDEYILPDDEEWMKQMVNKFHPAPHKLSPGAFRLMGRNAYQILGGPDGTPCKLVVAWTADGQDSGGTGQALRIAEDYRIPIFNLFYEEDLEKLRRYYKSL